MDARTGHDEQVTRTRRIARSRALASRSHCWPIRRGRAAACPLPRTPGNIYGPDGLT